MDSYVNHVNGVNGINGVHFDPDNDSRAQHIPYVQEPIAVVSMACRLPDECHTPHAFWKLLKQGKVAINTPPDTRFSLPTHYDGSLKPQTMGSPGGMFLQGIDPRDMDAQFFRLSGLEASSMDPQQRQLLEVVYEGLENGGITLNQLDGAPVGCFVSSYASDYGDIQAREPENRASSTVIGVGRAMLSNRLSHFLNIKGPSMTIDTACSGALIGLDLASRYLQTREISSAIVAGANLYCSPEHVMDHYMGANGAASLSGKCHTFDAKADGYMKAEAINMVYLKRLDDAIKDKDPIRAIIRGTATNSDGWTAGIASPNAEAQSAAIRQAYRNAGITDLSQTSYIEFHGTGTPAGDSIETDGVASVFCEFQSPKRPLRIGSVKSNIGHSEPAAGLSGLLKTVLSLEAGVIPGNPTFVDPNPKINFEKLRVRPSRWSTPWPSVPFRRAGINSFGYGGSNAHVIVDEAKGLKCHYTSSYLREEDDDLFAEELTAKRPYLLILSAADKKSLDAQFSALDKHLSNPAISVKVRDLVYTLGERRTQHYHRGFVITSGADVDTQNFVRGCTLEEPPKVGYVFTGQGAQWPEMGKSLLEVFPLAASTTRYLDEVLQKAYDPPAWSLYDELVNPRSAEHLQLPELSQPLVTAFQLAILAVLEASGIMPCAAVGHSSGEMAAAVATGYLTPEQAIKIAYYRGKATSRAVHTMPLGMMAVALGLEAVRPYLDGTSVEVACYNSPQSITLSGTKSELLELSRKIKQDSHFARILQVDAAYHSKHMAAVADEYQALLENHVEWQLPAHSVKQNSKMFSSTTGKTVTGPLGPHYWVSNMVSPVLFSQSVNKMITEQPGGGANLLIEIGPSNALSGPVQQISKAASLPIEYISAWKRRPDTADTLLEMAGKLFIRGCPIRLAPYNEDDEPESPTLITDLPNYSWNHSIKYWHESESSIDWRFRKFVHHDLLGSKVLGIPWSRPTWKNVLKLSEVTWLRDHLLGERVIFPAAAFIAMAIEAIFQKSSVTGRISSDTAIDQVTYKFRNVNFPHMLSLDQDHDAKIQLCLQPCSSTKETWHEFAICTLDRDGKQAVEEHCYGLVSISDQTAQGTFLIPPLKHAAASFERTLPVNTFEIFESTFATRASSIYKHAWHLVAHCCTIENVRSNLAAACQAMNADSSCFKVPLSRDVEPLRYPVPASTWYKAMRDIGYNFGPAFQQSIAIESKAGSLHSRALIKLDSPTSRFPQSRYAMHPTVIDGAMQISTVALNRGHRSAINTLMLPALIDDLVIFPQHGTARGIVNASAAWSGVGRSDDNKRYVSDIRLFSENSHDMLLDLQGFRCHAIDASVSKTHVFTQVAWSEDIDFLSLTQMADLLNGIACEEDDEGNGLARAAKVVALVAHKRPSARLFEVALDEGPLASHSLWIDQMRSRTGQIAEGCSYRLSTPGGKAGLEARDKYALEENIAYAAHDALVPVFETEDLEDENKFDVIVLKVSRVTTALYVSLRSARKLLAENGYLIIMQVLDSPCTTDTNGEAVQVGEISPEGFSAIPVSTDVGFPRILYLGTPKLNEIGLENSLSVSGEVHLVHFGSSHDSMGAARDLLIYRGWTVVEHDVSLSELPAQTTVLVLDEMFSPITSTLNEDQFMALRELLNRECRLLWVTMGSQMNVSHPELGLMFGAARSILAEYPSNMVMCLDVESNNGIASLEAIHTALKHLISVKELARVDSEFVERGGLYHISRVIADQPINHVEAETQGGAELCHDFIHGHESIIKLISQRPGTLDALLYTEISDTLPIADDEVEVEVHAAGLNFKDLANAMGIVPANEHQFGLECTGIVTVIGKDVTTVRPGDRVLVVPRSNGCFANRVRARWLAVYPLEDRISFEDGATLGVAIHTAVYGLMTLASVQKGQSVLIHSASGGVGLAAIDLCKYLGAKIYVTVGTDTKRDFLAEKYGIARDHMFSSRSTAFAAKLMKATGGRGVDVCLNSLTGDMLHESWRCIAENGSLIEIGKKDMLERHSLSMEPFDRNCSYRALDLSRKSITDEMTRKIGLEIMDLVRERHLKPLYICKVFSFDETVEAFRYMQRGMHIGKVVISYESSKSVKLPFRPATSQLQLRADGSYLIAGGFKGLCGSLAVYLCRQGAKNIVVISRSGYEDTQSQKTVYDCNALGCHVDLVSGDITQIDDVRRAFALASKKPVVGVIQGAMVLRDRMFSTMTPHEFREPLAPKVRGTWNLHTVAQEQQATVPLDFFTMLSSVSGLVGQLGQANYAAANAFLDSFAAYRLGQGLPACSVILGPVEDVGYLAGNATLDRFFEARGWSPIDEPSLHRILHASILQQTHRLNPRHAGQLVTGIRPGKLPLPFEPVHRFSALCPAAGGSSTALPGGTASASAATKLAMLKNASRGDVDAVTLLAAATELASGVLMRSLGISEALEPARPLANYGVDSLAAVEFRNWARAELGVEISAWEIVGAKTVAALGEMVLKKLLG